MRQEIGIWISQAREEVGLIKNVPDAYANTEMDRNIITWFEEVEFFALYKGIGVLYLTERTQLFTYDLTGHCNFTALRVNSGFKISFREYDKPAMRGVCIFWSSTIVQRFLQYLNVCPLLCVCGTYNDSSEDNGSAFELIGVFKQSRGRRFSVCFVS